MAADAAAAKALVPPRRLGTKVGEPPLCPNRRIKKPRFHCPVSGVGADRAFRAQLSPLSSRISTPKIRHSTRLNVGAKMRTEETVLFSGGSGFIAFRILEQLLDDGFRVVTTVRNRAKGDTILKHIPDEKRRHVNYVLVEDISKEGAFDECIKTTPSLRYIIHTASPVNFNPQDVMKGVINPAVHGATGILKSASKHGLGVRRVVMTSSTAAVVTPGKRKTYDESDWAPHTIDTAIKEPGLAYATSKVLAEKAAWKFMETTNPHFDLVVIGNTWTYGPIQPFIADLESVNASNVRIRDMITGKVKERLPPTAPVFTWVDVRDVAAAHVTALRTDKAGGRRIIVAGGNFSNKMVVEIVRERFPALDGVLPARGETDDIGQQEAWLDNGTSKEILGLKYGGLDESVVDSVASILKVMGR